VFVTTQAVPHKVCPPQSVPQTLLLQTGVAPEHVVVQSPQWVASEVTQEPLQSNPDWHLHWLFWQIWPVEQGIPQPAQFIGSLVVSTQTEPQAVCPLKQLLPVVPPAPNVPPVPVEPPELPLPQAAARNAKPSPKAHTRAVVMTPSLPAGRKLIKRRRSERQCPGGGVRPARADDRAFRRTSDDRLRR
jgi:hypothetical protein